MQIIIPKMFKCHFFQHERYMNNKNIKFHSIEMLNQTSSSSLIWNSFFETLNQTNDLIKALNAAAETSNKNCFTIPFWLVFYCDVLKLIRQQYRQSNRLINKSHKIKNKKNDGGYGPLNGGLSKQ